MNQTQVLGIAKIIVPVVITYAVGRGWVSESAAGEITAAIVTLIAALWSFEAHTDSANLATVEAMPDVKTIVVSRTSTDGVAAAAGDPTRPKVETELSSTPPVRRMP
jgi:TRAP-type C4-dicarboxylate transport system permease large subunit